MCGDLQLHMALYIFLKKFSELLGKEAVRLSTHE